MLADLEANGHEVIWHGSRHVDLHSSEDDQFPVLAVDMTERSVNDIVEESLSNLVGLLG